MTGHPTFGSGDRGHLGEAAAALVDGVLSHSERDLALAHITHCDACRREVDAQRQLKARLASLRTQALDVPVALTAALIAVNATPHLKATQPAFVRIPAYLPRHRARVAMAATVLVAAGLGVVLAIGGTEQEPGAPIQPTLTAFVDQHAATTGEVPLNDPGFVAVAAGFSR